MYNQIFEAAVNCDCKTVKSLLLQSLMDDPNYPSPIHNVGYSLLQTLISQASYREFDESVEEIEEDLIDCIEVLVKCGADVNLTPLPIGNGCETPLIMAVKYGYEKVLDLLLKFGAKDRLVEHDTWDFRTATTLAVTHAQYNRSRWNLVKKLIPHCVSLDAIGSEVYLKAKLHGRLDVCRMIVIRKLRDLVIIFPEERSYHILWIVRADVDYDCLKDYQIIQYIEAVKASIASIVKAKN